MMTTLPGKVNPAYLRNRGVSLCKPDPGTKSPRYAGWSTRSLEADDFGENDLIGIQGGALSDYNRPGHALVIIDCDDAKAVALADEFLPPTGMMEGKPDKPNDHRYYLIPLATIPEWAYSTAEQGAAAALEAKGHPGPAKRGFNHHEDNHRILDFIGTGGQAVCPSPGNTREWVGGSPGEPSVVPFLELWEATCKLAAACGWRERAHEPATARPSADRLATPLPTVETDPDLLAAIVKKLDRCRPAISGQYGHGALMWAARVVCWGFDRNEEEAFAILVTHYNGRCQPEWCDADLRHKVHDARTLPFEREPRGWLLAEYLEAKALREAKARFRAKHKTKSCDPRLIHPQPQGGDGAEAIRLLQWTEEELRARREAVEAAARIEEKIKSIFKGRAVKRANCGQGGSFHQRKVEANGSTRDRLARFYCGRHDCPFCFRGRKARTLRRACHRLLYDAGGKVRVNKLFAILIPTNTWKTLNRSLRRRYGDDCGRLRLDRTDKQTLVIAEKPIKEAAEVTPAQAVDRVLESIDILHPGKSNRLDCLDTREIARTTFRLLGSWSDAKEDKQWKVLAEIKECFDFDLVVQELTTMRRNPQFVNNLPGVRCMLEWRCKSEDEANQVFRELLQRCHLSANTPSWTESDSPPPDDEGEVESTPEEAFSGFDTGQWESF